MSRPRRLRQREAIRQLIRETFVSASQCVMPLFVRHGKQLRTAIPAMPGQFQYSLDQLVKECQELFELGIPAVLLFGLPAKKDERGSEAYAKDGIVQQAVRAIKAQVPELLIITDVCLCEYTTHGHCGLVVTRGKGRGARGGEKTVWSTVHSPRSINDIMFSIDNDATLPILAKAALSHVKAGADLVAPSDMMDGTVRAIRTVLDEAGFQQTPIMGYSAKFASAMYGPFRQAVGSAPAFGDRRSYQMDPANAEEALREVALDIQQGADIVMVKPALAYLDIIARVKQEFHHPVAAFNVSGEYSMVKAAAARGWINERAVALETLLAIKRAGADIIITYWAKEAAKWLKER